MRYCLTGGIGAGKSYVCSLLREKGVEIYDTDNAAKRLIAQSPEIRQQLKELIGGLDKQTIAAFLLKSEENKSEFQLIREISYDDKCLKKKKRYMEK